MVKELVLVRDLAKIFRKKRMETGSILFDKEEYENANKLIAIAFDLLKNTDHAKNFYEILNFIVANEDKFKDKKLFNKFREIREQYDQIIKAAQKDETPENK